MQRSLFDESEVAVAERPFPPASANTDPPTSRIAERQINTSGDRKAQCERVLSMVKQSPGSTSLELATKYGVDRHMAGRRLPDLRAMGRVKNGPARSCEVNGNKAVTWEIV